MSSQTFLWQFLDNYTPMSIFMVAISVQSAREKICELLSNTQKVQKKFSRPTSQKDGCGCTVLEDYTFEIEQVVLPKDFLHDDAPYAPSIHDVRNKNSEFYSEKTSETFSTLKELIEKVDPDIHPIFIGGFISHLEG